MINSNKSARVPLNNKPLIIIDPNKISLKNGKILEQVRVKISCIPTVPMKRATKMFLVQYLKKSADLKEMERITIMHACMHPFVQTPYEE